MRLPFARAVAGLLVVGLGFPAIAQVSEGDVRRARSELERVLGEARELGEQVEEAWARQVELEDEIETLGQSISNTRLRLREVEQRLEVLAVELYMATSTGISMTMLMSTANHQYQAGVEYLHRVNGSEQTLIDQLRVFRSELDRHSQRLAEASAEQATVTSDLEAMAADLQEELVAAQVFYDRLVERQLAEAEARRRAEEEARRREQEEARQATTITTVRASATTTTTVDEEDPTTTTSPEEAESSTTVPPPPSVSGGVCPVAGPVSFSDSWGAPRSGGRSHAGVDMIAARGTPAVAIFSGVIHRISSGSLGGLSVWLRASNGDHFYYAHLDSYGDITLGQTVSQGHLLGRVGTTGNAPDWLPHLHFEYHPGGGVAVNPYPLVRPIC
jgi:murein DD-endopeptidase MepM/ murein hydrolase activator NlpD